MKRLLVLLLCIAAAPFAAAQAARTLDIYFIDVEGGQSTLIVTAGKQSLLIDAGFPGDGTFNSKPGDPHAARDANRIVAAARDAGVSRIDVLLLTHFHADHDGGIPELSQLMPIGTFADHDHPLPEVESVKGSLAAFERYKAVRANGRHLDLKPGDRLPIEGVDAVVVSSARDVVSRPLTSAPKKTSGCESPLPPLGEPNENPRSTGVLLTFGKFRFLDVGDLTGEPLRRLVCPTDTIGPVDVYLVAHHGNADAADAPTFEAFRPRVAVVDDGERKGGEPALLAMLHGMTAVDTWQLHRSRAASANTADARIANLDETTSHWIKVSAHEDGSFTVTNARTVSSQTYPAPR
jgi:competence protein ComEC